MGGYERTPAPWGLEGIPRDFTHKLLAPDWERFGDLMELAISRVPAIGRAEVITLINGPEAFTPDGEFIMGEAPDVRGFFVAAGFCAHGIAGAGGVGKVMAEWILDGRPSIDVWRMDLRRFGAHYADRGYARAQAFETYSTYYDIHYPGEERRAGRGLKRSPVHARVEALGGAFGEKAGWERPNWLEANAAQSPRRWTPRGWSARHWSTAIEAEHRAARVAPEEEVKPGEECRPEQAHHEAVRPRIGREVERRHARDPGDDAHRLEAEHQERRPDQIDELGGEQQRPE
jgi:4-methylaminobutanoate oxidase (formaldehyde-forming)